MSDELVQIIATESDVESLMYRTLLQEAGIDVFERAPTLYPHTGMYGCGRLREYRLFVCGGDTERAMQLLRDYQAQAESGTLESELPPAEEIAAMRVDMRTLSHQGWLRTTGNYLILALILISVAFGLIEYLHR